MQYMDFQNGYQRFLDYQRYMQWQGAGSSTGGAADYEQYIGSTSPWPLGLAAHDDLRS